MAWTFYEKLRNSPEINKKLDKLLGKYQHVKDSSILLQFGFAALEMLLRFCMNFSLMLAFVQPKFVSNSAPIKFVDEFICHQVDYCEARLRERAGSIYVMENTLRLRLVKFFTLLCRIALIWPRLALVIIVHSYTWLRNEIDEDITLAKETFFTKSMKVRRSAKRDKAKKRHLSASKQTKRKFEDTSDEEVYEYLFYPDKSYRSEEDPDYVISETPLDLSEEPEVRWCSEDEIQVEKTTKQNDIGSKCKDDQKLIAAEKKKANAETYAFVDPAYVGDLASFDTTTGETSSDDYDSTPTKLRKRDAKNPSFASSSSASKTVLAQSTPHSKKG